MSKNLKAIFRNKTFLITGGTGSFGNTVVGTLIKYSPKKIIIFSRDEKKQFDMRNLYDNPTLKFVIGDVREKDSLERIMEGVDFIFHAAALKQVPSCEFFPIEAVKTNILGANNVIELAIKNKVKRVVILSTDKSVYPINAMGMTKALMEKTMVAASKNSNQDTVLCGVRYGNVLYSRGSVVPYFVACIKQDNQLPVTNLKMTRFLLPLPESIDLVLHALLEGKSGGIYVRKSPACDLETLAKALCQIFNYKEGYREVGVRAGEKTHETLVSTEEMFRSVDLGKYFEIPAESQGLDYDKYFFSGKRITPDQFEPFTSENTKRLDIKETVELLLSLPEIRRDLSDYRK